MGRLLDLLVALFRELLARLGIPLVPPFPRPRRKIVANCDFARFFIPEEIPDRPLSLGAGASRGTVAAGRIDVPAGTKIEVDGDLVLVARGDIRVEGRLERKPGATGRRTRHIALVSLEGEVHVGPAGYVGGGVAASGIAVAGPRGQALNRPVGIGGAGFPGSVTLLRGVTIDLYGTVQGEDGGDGGDVRLRRPLRYQGAYAIGGPGGFGGDVAICAVKSVQVGGSAQVRAGTSGDGGSPEATAGTHAAAVAYGGPAVAGGDVRITGTAQAGPCAVDIEGQAAVTGGAGGEGGSAVAFHGAPAGARFGPSPGGRASAQAAAGGRGGTVRFTNCRVRLQGTVRSGDGGRGGGASAKGGVAGALADGFAGGPAAAFGGPGGTAGDVPQVPGPGGTASPGATGQAAPGGAADATGGRGGDALDADKGKGGSSGASVAQAGRHGDGTEVLGRLAPPVPDDLDTGTGQAGRSVRSDPAP